MRFKMMMAVAASVLALAAACGGSVKEASPPSPADPSVLMEAARAHLAARLGVGVEAVEGASVEKAELPHPSCLNLPPGQDCMENALPGNRVILTAQGSEYVYYGYENGEVYPFEGQPPDSGSGEPGSAGGAAPPGPGGAWDQSWDHLVKELVEAARAHLAALLGVSVEAVEVASVERAELPHPSCLDIGPDEACIMIAVLGYRVTLAAEGAQYLYYAYPEDGGVYPAPRDAHIQPQEPPPYPGPTLSPDDVVSATPVPGPDIVPTPADPAVLAEAARAHLGKRLGIAVDAIKVVSVEQEWLPHPSCLNLEPGAACIEIAVDGYRVTLSAQGLAYAYYAYHDGEVYPVP